MMSNFPGSDHSCRRRYVIKLFVGKKNNNNKNKKNKNKEISRSGLSLPVEYLRNGKRYSSFVFTLDNGKSHATKGCNPGLCSCYHFPDIVVANIKNFKIFDFDVKFARATWYMPSNEFARHNNEIYICEAVCDAVREWSEVTRLSADCRTTIFRRFKLIEFFFLKSLNGHATVVGGHATVGRLSNNVFWTFQAIWENFEKSRWTVTRQWSEVTRSSADCQTTFFGRFKRFWENLKKVAERSRDSGWGHATVGRLSNNVFWTFQAIRIFLKKVAERSRDSGRRSRDCRPTIKQRFLEVSSEIWEDFKKCHWTVTGQWLRSRDRRPTVKQRFLDVSSDLGKFWKASLNGHAIVVGGHATVGRLSNNVFWTFQAIWESFEKSHWTVTGQWLRSRDRRPTVKQRFLDVSSDLGKFWKASLNGHATVVDGDATVGRLSNNDFSTFQAIRNFFEKSRWTVTRQWLWWRDRRPTVKQRFFDVSSN